MSFFRVVLPILIVFAIVGGATYMMQLAPPPPKTVEVVKASKPSEPVLRIPERRAVWDTNQPGYAREFEFNKEGNYDFWIANTRSEPIALQLRNRSCTCADVEISVVPPEKVLSFCQTVAPLSVATRFAGGHGFDPLGLALAPLIDKIERTQLKPMEGSFTIPPADERLGMQLAIVRMFFRAKNLGPQRLAAEVQAIAKDDTPLLTAFEVMIAVSPPVLIYPSVVPLGDIKAGEIRKQEFLLWSASRSEFPLVPPPLADDPCFVFSEPVPLTADECRRFAELLPPNLPPTRPKAGYRVSLTVHEQRGNAQLDLGPINRKLKFNIGSEFETEASVTGYVRGDVTFTGDKTDTDKIHLGEFYSDQPKSKSVQVRTSIPGAKLSVVGVSPEELQATLTERPGYWMLRIDVPPDTVVGNLPVGSHVMLQVVGAQSRRIKVAIDGAGLIR